MYHIYHTEGIILASTPTGESDRFFQILTPDLGLIPAVARGSRALTSKLRYHLVDHAHVGLDLVRGKGAWTITGALPRMTTEQVPMTIEMRVAMVRLSSFIRRLVHGEERSHELFSLVTSFQKISMEYVSPDDREYLFLGGCIHVLSILGYGSEDALINSIAKTPLSMDIIEMVASSQKDIRHEINRALGETQL